MATEFAITIDEYPFEFLAWDRCFLNWTEQYAELHRLRLAAYKEKLDS